MKTTKMNQSKMNLSTRMLGFKNISKVAVLALAFLFMGTASFAKSESSAKEKETTEIRKQLYAQIQFPKFLTENNTGDESVNVLFKVEKNGSIKVVKTDSSNESLNKFITEELTHAKLASLVVSEDNVYKINIRFKLL
jgi:hypothetical protein